MYSFLERVLYHLILKQRLWIINKTEKKIKKYKLKVKIYELYLDDIKDNTRDLLDRGTFIN
jgi:hypothetical protein